MGLIVRIANLIVTGAVALLLNTGVASAALLDFSFTPTRATFNTIEASGTFTTDDADVVSNIIDVTGTVNGVSIAGIAFGFNIYLTDFNAASFSFTDGNGITYTLNSGGTVDTASSDRVMNVRGNLEITPATVGTVPLPASAPMFGAALAALGALGYRAKHRARTAA